MKQIMEKLIPDYHLEEGSKLVYWEEGTNGVDCWFDANGVRQHRCLSFEDFEMIEIYIFNLIPRSSYLNEGA